MYSTDSVTSTGMATPSPIALIFFFAFFAFLIVANWKLYKKMCGRGLPSIIIIWNLIVYFRCTMGSAWWALAMLIPGVNVVVSIISNVKLAKAFGHGGGFAVGLIFLPYVFMPYLAFSKDQYLGVPGKEQPAVVVETVSEAETEATDTSAESDAPAQTVAEPKASAPSKRKSWTCS